MPTLTVYVSPSGYWQVKLERSYTRVSRFSRHPSAVKSAGSTAAGPVARLLSADDNLPSTFLSAGHEQAGRRAGLIAASGRVVALVPSRRTRRVVRQRPLAWRQASNPARPWLPGRRPSRFGRQMVTAPTRVPGAPGHLARPVAAPGTLARPETRQTHGTNEIAEANGVPVPGLVTQRHNPVSGVSPV
jgi:hypothetical protein